jgi:hypothetical protein
VAENGDQVALAARFDAQDAEPVLCIVEGDALDQTSENLGWRACLGWLHHPRMMDAEMAGFHNSFDRVNTGVYLVGLAPCGEILISESREMLPAISIPFPGFHAGGHVNGRRSRG